MELIKKYKKEKTSLFLNKLAEQYSLETDVSVEMINAAISYMNNNELNENNIDDVLQAAEMIQIRVDRLISIQEYLVQEKENPTSISWINEEQENLVLIQQGLLRLMLQLRKGKSE